MTKRAQALVPGLVLWTAAAAGVCPVGAGQTGALAVATDAGRIRSWNADELRSFVFDTWTETRSVGREGRTEASRIAYGGVRLREVLEAALGTEAIRQRAFRNTVFEAVATDGYVAVFSWGEIFNAPAGEQTIVVLSVNGQPLDAGRGTFALRAPADTRPGPRHVCDLCGLRVRFAR